MEGSNGAWLGVRPVPRPRPLGWSFVSTSPVPNFRAIIWRVLKPALPATLCHPATVGGNSDFLVFVIHAPLFLD